PVPSFVLETAARHGPLTVAAGLGGEVDDDRAGSHAFDGTRRDELRRRPPRDSRGRDDDVEVGDPLLERALLLRLLLRCQLGCIAACGLFCADAEIEEAR